MTTRRTYAPPKPPRPRWRHPLVLLAGVVLLAAVTAGGYGIWYLFLQGPGPAAVGGSASLAPLPSGLATVNPASDSAAGDFNGTWTITSPISSIEDTTGSFVGYRVQETLQGIGAQVAVGRTGQVTGSLTIANDQVTAADFTADLTTLTSDDDRRDGQLERQGIQTDQFPTAEFKLSEPITGTVPAEGVEVSVTAKGQVTLHGVTKDVEIPLKAKWSGSVIQIAGSIAVVFADYSITPPTSFAVLSIADTGTMEVQLLFTKSV